MIYYLNTDGACKNNQDFENSIGGWGFLLSEGSPSSTNIVFENFGGELKTTNNRMEILAVIQGLTQCEQKVFFKDLTKKDQIIVFTDSQYVVNTMKMNYKRNKNIDLWTQLDAILEKIRLYTDVNFCYVKGHNGDYGNSRADELANRGCASCSLTNQEKSYQPKYPLFISLEGLDGSGKTTQLEFIKNWFKQKTDNVIFTREPGGTPLGEALRPLFLNMNMLPETEWLMLYAGRHEHLQTVILPAMTQGTWVVSDRFNDSSFAYQAAGRKMNESFTTTIDQLICKEVKPSLTIYLDVPIELSQERLSKNEFKDRLESEAMDFHFRVREAYLTRAKEDPNRIKIIDASQSVAEVSNQIEQLLEQHWKLYA